MAYHGYVAVQKRGTIALPPEIRRRFHLDTPGAQVEITEIADGVFELRPMVAVPADQAWFWTEEWQRKEREADEDYAAGRFTTFNSTEEFLAHLDEMCAEADADDADRR